MKLTLRELFLLVVIAAMGCGWWVERERLRSRLADEQEKTAKLTRFFPWRNAELAAYFEEYLRNEGYKVTLTTDSESGFMTIISPSGTTTASGFGPGPSAHECP